MSKPEEAGKHESILAHHYHEARETWHRTPFLHRILSFTIFFFALLFICFTILLVDDATEYTAQQDLMHYPELLRLFGDVVAATSVESELSVQFSKSQTLANWNTLAAARSVVDGLQQKVADFLKLYNSRVTIDPDHALLQGSRLSETGIGSTYNARSQITYGQVILPAQAIRSSYSGISARVLQQMAKTAATLNSRSLLENTIKAAAIAAMQWHLGQGHAAVRVFLASPVNTTKTIVALKDFVFHLTMVNTVSTYLLQPYLTQFDLQFLSLQQTASQLRQKAHDLLIAATAGTSYTATFPVSVNATFASVRTVLQQVQSATLSELKSVDNSHYSRSFVMAVLALLAVVAAGAQWIIFESLNAERNAIRIRNAHVMHDVLVRVEEFVDHMATFTLDPPPPPRSMMGTRVGVLELRLQHCLASLKTLAPTLPSLLFPKRLSALAAEYSEVKDPATMQFARKLRDSLLKEPLQQVTLQDIIHNKHSDGMRDLTMLQVHDVNAAFLFVDLSFFHEMSTVEKMQFSHDSYKEIASVIEECVYQFKGVLHSLNLDRAVGVWNVATKAANYCEQAATCGLVLSSRLAHLRRHNKGLRENFHVRIGIVAGEVRQGIFGDKGAKYLQMFGEPLEMGIKVARANAFHMTTVACDETVRRAVEKIYLAKPIELLEDGQCIYEVIHEGSRREADLETQLLVYSKAFELFEKKYYREALRAFRAYTKLYGYDSSVERIQAIITGM